MKIKIIRAMLIVMLLGIFYIIFGFSGQEGEKSGSISRQITEAITKNINQIQNKTEEQKEIALKKIEHVIRKLAHFSLYTVVGILMMSLMSTYSIKQMKRYGASLGVGIIYAISDEIHQSFIPDRTPAVGDVFIDTCGVVFGIILVRIFIMINFKIKMRNKNVKKYISE